MQCACRPKALHFTPRPAEQAKCCLYADTRYTVPLPNNKMQPTLGQLAILLVLCSVLCLFQSTRCDIEYFECNSKLCASPVSYCMLVKACACDNYSTNLTCAQNCTTCLESLYQECCSCIGLCKPTIHEIEPSRRSNVELFVNPDNEMFDLLSREQPVSEGKWRMHNFTYKVQFHMDEQDNPDQTVHIVGLNESVLVTETDLDVTCTVAYLSQCMAMHKCKNTCGMLGASAFRWFHNACCQCVGRCDPSPYGEDQAKCDLCLDDELPATQPDADANENVTSQPTNEE